LAIGVTGGGPGSAAAAAAAEAEAELEVFHDLSRSVYAHLKQREHTRQKRAQRLDARRAELRALIAKSAAKQ
jgi:hypothetical protein